MDLRWTVWSAITGLISLLDTVVAVAIKVGTR
jgi:hypothetical protein